MAYCGSTKASSKPSTKKSNTGVKLIRANCTMNACIDPGKALHVCKLWHIVHKA